MLKETQKNKPLFPRPVGAGDEENEFIRVGNTATSTTRAVTCELCGTNHPERDSADGGYILFTFLGLQGVMECCGKVIDVLYDEWHRLFFKATLAKFKNDPLSEEHYYFREAIHSTVREWKARAVAAVAIAGQVDTPEEP